MCRIVALFDVINMCHKEFMVNMPLEIQLA